MKKTMRNLLLILTVVTLMMSSTVTAFATGTVTYDGNAKKFIFEPGSKYSPTDLFSDFKGVMPGDSITQKVGIVLHVLTVTSDAVELSANIHIGSTLALTQETQTVEQFLW